MAVIHHDVCRDFERADLLYFLDWEHEEAMTACLEIPAAVSTLLGGSQYPTITASISSFRRLMSHCDFYLSKYDREVVICEASELLKNTLQSYAKYFGSEPAKVAQFLDVVAEINQLFTGKY
jgi:hypothetical protein